MLVPFASGAFGLLRAPGYDRGIAFHRLASIVCLTAFSASAVAATVQVEDDAGLRAAIAGAKPGTTILVAPGTYRGGLHVAGWIGTEEAPIVLAGLDPERPPVLEGGGTGLQISRAAHVEIRDLVFTGATANGLNIDDGGVLDVPSRNVTVRRVTVRDIGPTGNRDGIKLSGLDGFLIADCRIERWGDSGSGVDMVGCHDGVIERCTLRHDGQATGSGVQAKGGSRDVTIRRCRFEGAGGRSVNIGGSTGAAYFRPQEPGYEAKDITVEDCTFVGSWAPVAFVGVDGAVVRHNTIYRPTKWVLRILQESRGSEFVACRNGRFERNLIVFRAADVGTVVNVGAGTEPESFVFERNYWFCEDDPDGSAPRLPVPERDGSGGKDPGFVDPETGDLRLREDSPAGGYGVRSE